MRDFMHRKPRTLVIPYPEIVKNKIYLKERAELFKGFGGWWWNTRPALAQTKPKPYLPTMFKISYER